jgi:hypothetical protein
VPIRARSSTPVISFRRYATSYLLFTEHHLGFTALLVPFMDLVPDPIQRISVGTISRDHRRPARRVRLRSASAPTDSPRASPPSPSRVPADPRRSCRALLLGDRVGSVVAILAVRLVQAPTRGYAVALGLAAAWLGWRRSHLAVMGGLFAASALGAALFATPSANLPTGRRLAAFALAGLLRARSSSAPFAIPQAATLWGNGFDRPLAEQAREVPTPLGLVGTPWMGTRRWAQDVSEIAPAGGEVFAGMSPWWR